MSNKDFFENSYLFGANSTFVEEIYKKYIESPDSVSNDWKSFFSSLEESNDETLRSLYGASWSSKINRIVDIQEKKVEALAQENKVSIQSDNSLGIYKLIEQYRYNGHLVANLDPLNIEEKEDGAEGILSHQANGLNNEDLDIVVKHNLNIGKGELSVKELISHLRQIYCSTVGFEFAHIHSIEEKDWLFNKIESTYAHSLNSQTKIEALKYIQELEGFEQFLHTRFPGAKRFSVEGGETSILAAYHMIKNAAENSGIKEAVIGMAHRGRLNVLTKLMGKSYAAMLSEFQGNLAHMDNIEISGDVKYHLGKSSDFKFGDNNVHMSLTANPSHLEAVNPVVLGKVRAKQDQYNDTERNSVIGILFHGDAAFAGQGVVAESLSLGGLEGYRTGGTIHVVINNQIGFTTSPHKSRVGRYPTEVAKIVQAPIIHVNGDDPEAVIKVSSIAEEYRKKFKKDIVLDIICYRKYGHNEGDEPMFTQPKMYSIIKQKKTSAALYAEKLIKQNLITATEIDKLKKDFYNFLDEEYKKSKTYKPHEADWLAGKWAGLAHRTEAANDEITGISQEVFETVAKAICKKPEAFTLNSKVSRMLDAKEKALSEGEGIDWAAAEALAYGSLLYEGSGIRLSGQDCGRGTFSHRHAVLVDQVTEKEYIPLQNISSNQGRFEIVDSNLSEFAVLGFEYGYSIVNPRNLTIWEAQFGDFSNGAQIIIDQFISSAETKWMRMSGLVMLLPHGYEGQGPEHSSARLERYLQLCAEHNMQVVNCTTPANFFHVLRRQLHRDFRKPVVVMSPKSLLRHKLVASSRKDFIDNTHFKKVIGETSKISSNEKIRKVILCSGKVYYDLYEEREKQGIKDVAIIRLEQYYPFPYESLFNEIKDYKNADIVWCQEEPKNMGAWHYIAPYIGNVLRRVEGKSLTPTYIGREKAASPAAGYAKVHALEQQKIIDEALK